MNCNFNLYHCKIEDDVDEDGNDSESDVMMMMSDDEDDDDDGDDDCIAFDFPRGPCTYAPRF